MEAKDTVMTEVVTIDETTFLPPKYISWLEHHNLMREQAKITWSIAYQEGIVKGKMDYLLGQSELMLETKKAGIKEVVELAIECDVLCSRELAEENNCVVCKLFYKKVKEKWGL